MLRFIVAAIVAFASLPLCADTVWWCRSYHGAEFLSNRHCSQSQALVLRSDDVPAGMTFEQQAEVARGMKARSDALLGIMPPAASVRRSASTTGSPNADAAAQPKVEPAHCSALNARIAQLDAMARQPLPARMQDRIAAERSDMRSEQFRFYR